MGLVGVKSMQSLDNQTTLATKWKEETFFFFKLQEKKGLMSFLRLYDKSTKRQTANLPEKVVNL